MLLSIKLPNFLEVVSSGPGGLIVASIFFGVFLLILEQRREEPRKSIMIAIYSLIGCCFLGALVMILSNKSDNNDNYLALKEQLNSLTAEEGRFHDAYIVDKHGDPKSSKIIINGTDSVNLTAGLTSHTLYNQERSYDIGGDSVLRIKTDNGTYLGYVDLHKLENEFHFKETRVESEDILYASLKRGSIEEHVVEMHLPKDLKQAGKYLVKILHEESDDQIVTNAGKVLVQRELLNTLDAAQYQVLLDYLNSNKRKLPFRYWELAQVYTMMYSQDILLDKETSRLKKNNSYKQYISWYEDPINLNTFEKPETKASLAKWYDLSKLNLDPELAD